MGIVSVYDNQPVRGHDVHQATKREFDVVQRLENVGMIEL
jgi:hypothetical protein